MNTQVNHNHVNHHDETKFKNSLMYLRMMGKAEDITRAVFGEIDSALIFTQNWFHFRNFLLHNNDLDHMRSDPGFKLGVQLVIYIIEELQEIEEAQQYSQKEKQLFKRLAEHFIGEAGFGNDEGHKAVLKLIECLEILQPFAIEYDLADEDFNDLLIVLETIERCQQIALKASEQRI